VHGIAIGRANGLSSVIPIAAHFIAIESTETQKQHGEMKDVKASIISLKYWDLSMRF
jgi:hypothetical protein